MNDYFCETNWFAIHAKPSRERVVASHLASNGLEVFLPEMKSSRGRAHGSNRAIRPLFPGYLFAAFCPMRCFHEVRYAPGVLRVVGTSHLPIPVAEEIIGSIRELIQEDGYARLAPRLLHPGDHVCIGSGPLEGTIGRFEHEWDDGRRVTILLETIQKARVVIDRDLLEVAGVQ